MPCFFFSTNVYAAAGSGACCPQGPAYRSRVARSAGSTQNMAISSGVGGAAGGGASGAAQPESAVAAARTRSVVLEVGIVPLWRGPEREARRDFLTDLADEARGHRILVAGGAEGVPPLLVGQLRQPLAGPAHVGGGEVPEQLAVEAAEVVELHGAVGVHALDEALLLEIVDVAAGAGDGHDLGPPQRGP